MVQSDLQSDWVEWGISNPLFHSDGLQIRRNLNIKTVPRFSAFR